MIKIAHTADNHLRATQYARRDRGEDFFLALQDVVIKASDEGCDAILNSGDIIDTTRPSPYVVYQLKRIHRELKKRKLWMFTISGNHDKTEPHWTNIFADDDDEYGIKLVDNEVFKIPGSELQVAAFPYMTREALKVRLKEVFPDVPSAEVPRIIMWHGIVSEFADFPNMDSVEISDFPGICNVLLGDIHKREYRHRDPGTIIGYPGSTELCASNEHADKTFTILELDEHGKLLSDPRFVEITTRPVRNYRINNEDDMMQSLSDIKQAPKNALIFVKFNDGVKEVVSRIRHVINSDVAILKAQRLPTGKFDVSTITRKEDDLQPSDFLKHFFTPGTKLFDTADSLLQPDAAASEIMDKYIANRLCL
jgi:DNA repair exonuclease SbcCD nuclease subunit